MLCSCRKFSIILKSIKNLRKCSHFTYERLLSDENREHFLNCLKLNSLYPPTTTTVETKRMKMKLRPKFTISTINAKDSGDNSGSGQKKKFSSTSSTTATLKVEGMKPKLTAAVLIPVCVDNKKQISILYTRRSGKLSRHVRQISFPGGIKDEIDVSYEDCALRETEEEIGLNRKRVRVWGSGKQIQIPDRPPITPVIGVIENFTLNQLKLNKDEVEEAFTIPINTFCLPEVMKHTQFKSGYSTPVYLIDNGLKRIWGITAVITKLFLTCFLDKNVYKHKIEYIKPYKIIRK